MGGELSPRSELTFNVACLASGTVSDSYYTAKVDLFSCYVLSMIRSEYDRYKSTTQFS